MKHMNRNLIAASFVLLACACVASAQGTASPTETDVHYTQAQVKELARSAHSPDQYKVLANYYSGLQKGYLQEAAEEKKEWERRSQNAVSILAKYPRPVDSARNLYEYYMYKASEAGNLEAKYSGLASPDAPAVK
jgi:hypothetical protein